MYTVYLYTHMFSSIYMIYNIICITVSRCFLQVVHIESSERGCQDDTLCFNLSFKVSFSVRIQDVEWMTEDKLEAISLTAPKREIMSF